MKKCFFVFSLFIICFWAKAQNNVAFSIISGVVSECKNNVPLSYVHVVNETSKNACIADFNGNFRIYAKPNDILKFSYIGFKPVFIEMNVNEINKLHSICLSSDTILLKEVVVLPFSNFNELKHEVLAIKLKESEYSIPGITLKNRTTVHNLNDEKYVKSLGFALSSPISALYYNFSRREKNIRKYYQLENDKWQQYEIDKKYNKNVVESVTGLKNDDAVKFMVWCNFTREYLLLASEYNIALRIKEKYVLYCENIEHK